MDLCTCLSAPAPPRARLLGPRMSWHIGIMRVCMRALRAQRGGARIPGARALCAGRGRRGGARGRGIDAGVRPSGHVTMAPRVAPGLTSGVPPPAPMQPSIRIALAGQCGRAATMLCGLDALAGAGGLARGAIAQALESYVNARVYDAVFPWLLSTHEDTTRALSATLGTLKRLDQAAMGVPAQFRVAQDTAVGVLQSIGAMRTPLEKMQCMTLAARCMVEAVEAKLEADGVDTGVWRVCVCDSVCVSASSWSSCCIRLFCMHVRVRRGHGVGWRAAVLCRTCVVAHLSRVRATAPDSVDLATDDLLDLLIYVIVQGHPHTSSMVVELDYIQRFHCVATNSLTVTGCARVAGWLWCVCFCVCVCVCVCVCLCLCVCACVRVCVCVCERERERRRERGGYGACSVG